MTIEIDQDRFSLDKQTESETCWAETTAAILNYHKRGSATAESLIEKFGSKRNNPAKILEKEYNFQQYHLREKTPKDEAKTEQSISDLRENIRLNLGKGPMLASLMEVDDALKGKDDRSWHHAIVITAMYNEESNEKATVVYSDPAKGSRKTLSIKELAEGFLYISQSEIGAKAEAQYGGDLGSINARLRLLYYLMPKAGSS